MTIDYDKMADEIASDSIVFDPVTYRKHIAGFLRRVASEAKAEQREQDAKIALAAREECHRTRLQLNKSAERERFGWTCRAVEAENVAAAIRAQSTEE